MNFTAEESWRNIPGHDFYEISDMGNVRSLDREVTFIRNGNSVIYRYKGKNIRPTIANTGYPVVGLGNKKIHLVHRLVLLAFVGEAPEGHLCAHNDGTRNNNHLSNLRWTTQLDNSHDRISHGTNLSGENHPRSKLTAQQVAEMRALKGRVSQSKIAEMFSVCPGTVSLILSGKIWRCSENSRCGIQPNGKNPDRSGNPIEEDANDETI